MSDLLTSSALARAVGYALVQFLWQGAAIGAVTVLLLIALRRSSAHLRYVVGCLGLAAMCVAPIVTAAGHFSVTPTPSVSSVAAPKTSTTSPLTTTPSSDTLAAATDTRPALFSAAWLEPRLPFVVLIWSGGVLVLALDLLRGWMRVRRIRGTATPILEIDWPETMRTMAARLGVTRRVRLVASALTDVPAVIGWLRPVIVVPASVLAGLPPAHLDAILAHELAHVRRWDYLVNVLQCVVEILLFYHPAVWWVSRQIRLEREHCCDDLAAALCSNRVAYAHALASLEELRSEPPQLAMAASGGHLLNRVRRQIEPGFASGPRLSGGVAMGVVLTILLCVAVGNIEGKQVGRPGDLPYDPLSVIVVTPVAPTPANPAPRPAPAKLAPRQGVAPTPPPSTTARGGIIGRVVDQGGGVIPGVTVTVSSSGSAEAKTGFTNARGDFAFANLPTGTYDVTAMLQGFKTFKGKVQVAANVDARQQITLLLGALSETVQIKGSRTNPAPPPQQVQVNMSPQTADEALDAAKSLYQQARFAEAEAMTNRALELVRALARAAQQPITPREATSNSNVQPLRVGGSIREPKRIKYVEPIYPAEAIAAGVEGYIIIEARIDTDGFVNEPRVVKGIPLLDAAALGAVRQWVYSPTQLDGQAVEVLMTVTVVFSLK